MWCSRGFTRALTLSGFHARKGAEREGERERDCEKERNVETVMYVRKLNEDG